MDSLEDGVTALALHDVASLKPTRNTKDVIPCVSVQNGINEPATTTSTDILQTPCPDHVSVNIARENDVRNASCDALPDSVILGTRVDPYGDDRSSHSSTSQDGEDAEPIDLDAALSFLFSLDTSYGAGTGNASELQTDRKPRSSQERRTLATKKHKKKDPYSFYHYFSHLRDNSPHSGRREERGNGSLPVQPSIGLPAITPAAVAAEVAAAVNQPRIALLAPNYPTELGCVNPDEVSNFQVMGSIGFSQDHICGNKQGGKLSRPDFILGQSGAFNEGVKPRAYAREDAPWKAFRWPIWRFLKRPNCFTFLRQQSNRQAGTAASTSNAIRSLSFVFLGGSAEQPSALPSQRLAFFDQSLLSETHGSGGVWSSSGFFKRSLRKHDRKFAGVSYADLLIDSSNKAYATFESSDGHRHGVRGSVTVSMLPLPMTRDKKDREEMNREFRRKYPWVHASITMSKLQNLKHDLFQLMDKMPHLDPSTVALAWVYFERLVSNHLVHKKRRKQFAGACLVLAFKFNQALRPQRLLELIQTIQTLDRKDHLRSHDIFAVEFHVFAGIGFNLKVSFPEIARHLDEYFSLRANQSFESEYGVSMKEFAERYV